jgi:GDP-D-mannose dehydratase
MPSILISGPNGFVGSHLIEFLQKLDKDISISGICRWRSNKENFIDAKQNFQLFDADLLDLGSLIRVLDYVKPDIIFHLAAQSYVVSSFNYPVQTITTNIIGTVNLLEAIRILKLDPIVHICGCYDEKTELLTKRGFIKYNEIKEDDKVVSINPENNVIEYKSIKKIIIDDYSGDMININTRSIDLSITPNHKILFKKLPYKKLEFIEAREIKDKNARYYLPNGIFVGKKDKFLKIGSVEHSTVDIFYLTGLYIGDGYSNHQIKKIKNKSGLERNDFLKFARGRDGKFIKIKTEGREYSLQNSYRIFLCIPEKDKARKKAIECLNNLKINYKLYKDTIYFNSKDFYEFFNNMGHTAKEKNIPEWMLEFDLNYLNCLYNGLIDSDGSYYKTGERFTTISEKLRDSFSRLCILTGRFNTFCERKNRKSIFIKDREVNCKTSYDFSVSNKERMFEGKNIKKENYVGKIWCLEIEDTHNFVIRRNGKTHFCGNSSEVYGMVDKKYVPIREDCPFNPSSPYAVGKVGEDMAALQYFNSYSIKTIRTRAFSHTGPRRGEVFAASAFAKQLAAIRLQLQDNKIFVGNLESVRTFSDVRDTVRAYWFAVTLGVSGEVYNIGGIQTIKIGDLLNRLFQISGLNPEIQVVEKLIRPSDVTSQIPCVEKFTKQTGWKPEIPLDRTLIDLYNYWLIQLKQNPWKLKGIMDNI